MQPLLEIKDLFQVCSRYSKFLMYLGVPPGDVSKTKAAEFLKVIAEFALEYRTTRERVLQQLEKRANHRERNKTRGKMIIDVSMIGFASAYIRVVNPLYLYKIDTTAGMIQNRTALCTPIKSKRKI